MDKRIIALDVGDRRIGIAVSDPLGITAQPIETYTRIGYGPDSKHIAELAAKYDTDQILCGLPRNMDGTQGFQVEKVREFAGKLEEKGLVISYYDERMTTMIAEGALLEGNVRREDRKKKVDMVAAVMILQSYLDAKAFEEAQAEAEAAAADMQCKLLPLIDACFSEVNPIPAKAGVSAMGFGEEHLRLPLTPMEDDTRAKLYEEMRKLGINV